MKICEKFSKLRENKPINHPEVNWHEMHIKRADEQVQLTIYKIISDLLAIQNYCHDEVAY